MSTLRYSLLCLLLILPAVGAVASDENGADGERPVSAAQPVVRSADKALFNGKDLSGWRHFLQDETVTKETVWQVDDRVLICKGKPAGYIQTNMEYADYQLTLEWRWKPGSEGGNSGVLVHASTPQELGIWPKSIEVQLGTGEAGDFWVIGETIKIDDPDGRIKGRRHLNLTDESEKPLGEWNTMVILCKQDTVTVTVNGELVNQATDCSVRSGSICLQSEGAEVHFRNILLRPISETN